MSKKIFATALLLLSLNGCAKKEPEVQTPDPTPSEESSADMEETQQESQTEWTTYESTNYNFSLEYPATWTVEADTLARPYALFTSPERLEAGKGSEGDQMILIDAKVKVYASESDLPNNKTGLSFSKWIQSDDPYLNGSVSSTTVDGEEAYAVDGTSSFDGSKTHFLMVEHNGKIYELNFNVADADDYTSEREHMLESFQFTGSEAISSSTDSCEDEDCLMTKFTACEATTFSEDQGFAAITYEIFGPKDGGCEMSLVYSKNPNPEWVDKSMTCTFDNSLDFMTAVGEQLQAAYTGESTCSGPLAEVLADL